jgi:4-carboxymuconolactone decarboxylase
MAPRIPPLPPEERDDEARRLVEATRGELNVFTTLVRHPALFADFSRFGGRLLWRSLLADDEREILILRTAYRCRAAYEWAQHTEIAGRLGMPAEVIAAIESDEIPADQNLALLLSAADQLVAHRDLDDETWAALRGRYDDRQLIELCMLVGSYAMLAGTLKALRVPLEEGQTAPPWA